MAKTKISEFSSTPANNTDIDSINIAEGCAPSNINDAIRELMAQLKDFQTGAVGDSFNGPIGSSTASTGAFTNITASGTLGVTGVATLGAGAILNTPASVTLTNATGLPISTGVSGLGTGVATALAVNVGSAGAPVVNGGALGTPSSGTVTNLTGTASININGTVGATTPTTGAFTTVAASGAVTISGGTANGVTYLNGSKVLTSGSALTFDGTNLVTSGNISVGISPSYPLHVVRDPSLGAIAAFRGTSTAANSRVIIAGNSSGDLVAASDTSGNGLLYSDTSKTLGFGTNGSSTAKMLLNTSGNLGLGVTPSAWGTASSRRAIQLGYAGGGAIYTSGAGDTLSTFVHGSYNNGTNWIYGETGIASGRYEITGANAGSTHAWYNSAGGTAGNTITFTQAMTLDAAGDLGIGVTSPIAKLDVNKTSVDAVSRTNAIGAFGDFAGLGAGLLMQQTLSSPYGFALQAADASNTSRFPLLLNPSGGNVGVGTTSPQRTLHVYSASAIPVQIESSGTDAKVTLITSSGSSGQGFIQASSGALLLGSSNAEKARIDSSGNLLVGKTSASTTTVGAELRATGNINSASASSTNADQTFLAYSTGAAASRFYVDWGGTVHATSTTISAISDQRLKENIRDLDEGLATVMALKPRKFDWKEGKGQNIKNARGFIAQEFETVLPDMIEEWRDPAPEGEEAYKAINVNLIPTLVKAIQELKAEFDAYKASHP